MDEFKISNAKPEPAMLILDGENGEILKFHQNGDIYVHGKLIENDKEVVEGFRVFLRQQGLL